MRAYDSPYIADWFAISLRWLALFGLIGSLTLGGELIGYYWVLGILALWNTILSILAGLNRRLPYHRQISVLIDLGVAGVFFWLVRGFESSASWVGLLPILSASIYFEFKGLIVALIMAGVEIAVTWIDWPAFEAMRLALAAAGVTLALGLIFGFLSRLLINSIRRMRLQQSEARQRTQRLESERLRAIYNLTSTLTATLNYQRVLDSALDLGMDALKTRPGDDPDLSLVSAVMLFSDEQLIIGSARRFTSGDMRISLPAQGGLLARSITMGKPILEKDIHKDVELSRVVALRACRSGYCVPLISGYSIFGVLLFAHPLVDFFSQDRKEVLDIIGHQTVIAIQNAKLYQDLVEEKERIVEAQEEARKKLARDLHDGPTQSVAALAMRLNIARRLVEKNPSGAVDEISKIEDMARRTTKEIRHMLFTLRPLVLESQGLVAALEAMSEKMKETYNQNVIVEVDQNLVDQLEMGKQGVIFYIVEEAVTNARKHARAAHIWVRLRTVPKDDFILLEIQDDGAGFDLQSITQTYEKRGSLGMVNLRERTELISGMLNIQSAPGRGTRVQVYIPLTEEAADRLHHAKAK